MEQVEETQPIQPEDFHRTAGEGGAAVKSVTPDDVLIAEQFS
jgi:hypothetical protein